MKKQPLDLTPPRWAKKLIIELARDAGMTPDGVYSIVVKLGVEAATNLLETQINLIASLREGPIDESNSESNDEREAGAVVAQEPQVLNSPLEGLNGSSSPHYQETREGSDNAGERREESPEGPKNDFVDTLTIGPGEGVENATVT